MRCQRLCLAAIVLAGLLRCQLATAAEPEEVHSPRGYDFATSLSIIKAEQPLEEFYAEYRAELATTQPDDDPYGQALANQVLGLLRHDPNYIDRAKILFAAESVASGDPREKEASRLAARYEDELISGRFPRAATDGEAPTPVEIVRVARPARTFSRIVIGRAAIRVDRDSRIKTQVDRVTRDWQLGRNVDSAPWQLALKTLVPWHEGNKVKELASLTGATVTPVWGTRVRKIGAAWYAPDATGQPRFELAEDKVVNYPTTIPIDDRTAIVNDTHGISAIAWDCLDANMVVGCGDHKGKMDAAYYLAEQGVNVYVPTDRFIGLLVGARTRGTIIGSGPIRKTAGGAVIGNQPIAIDVDEPIVVSTATGGYPIRYYDAPHRYFAALAEFCGRPMHITAVQVNEYGRGDVVVEQARKLGAKVIGIRIKSRIEHDAVSAWLKEDKTRRAVLFHSAVYPDGYKLFFEYPEQTSFGDIYPVFE